MLQLWIGRAKTGKSERILREIKRLGDASRQILLVPEHASHQAEMDLCEVCGNTASRHAEVLSFRNLATRVLSLTGGIADYMMDNGGKLLQMEKTLTELAPYLKVYRRPSQKVAFLSALVGLMDEFYSYAVSPTALAREVAEISGAAGEKLRDLALIYGGYDAKLHREGYDARDRMTRLADNLEASRYIDGKDVFIDGFSYFNGQEERTLAQLLRRARSVTITLLGDRSEKGDIFSESFKTRDRLARLAQDAGCPCEITWFSGSDDSALTHLEQCFFGKTEPWEGCAESLQIWEANTSFSEAEQVAAEILRLVATGDFRFRDIAVAARNMPDYEATLENVFERYGIPFFGNRRSDILEKPVLQLILGVLEATAGGYEYEEMFRFLKTGLAGLTPADCDILENYVLKWEIHGRMWLRDSPWTANPDGYGAREGETQAARLAQVNLLRERVRLPLLRLSEGMKTSESALGKVKALYSYLEEIQLQKQLEEKILQLRAAGESKLAEEYTQLWDILCGVMDQMVETLGEDLLPMDEFTKLFRLILTQYSVGTIPVSLDQVSLSEITRNDRHTVKVLFLLGANDHVLPAVDTAGGLLGEDDREELLERGIRLAPTGLAQFNIELQNLYAALAQPTARLYVSYPVTDVSGAELRPAFVIGRMKTLFPSLLLRRESPRKDYRRAAILPALEAAGEAPGGALWQYFARRGDPRLGAMAHARELQRGKLSRAASRALYGEQIAMSASRIDKLKSCHFAYFMQYGLRAKEREPARFDAPEIGTFLHDILEKVTADAMAAGGFSKLSRAELHHLIGRHMEEYVQRELDNFKDRNARFRYLFQRLRKTVYAVVENVAAELAESDFIPLAFELSFGREGALPAITVTEAETSLSLGGKVDRVDGWVHEGKLYLRVVDYKTGKKSFDLSEIRSGIGIQMLLYLFALQREGADYFGKEIVPAGVLYLPARDTILRMDRNTPPEAIEAAVAKELRRSGMLLEAPEVLRAMEHSALEEPHFLPINVGKDGNIRGAIASAAQLGRLGQYIEQQLRQIAREMQEGVIDADPCCRSEEDSYCRYCDFASACHFEDGHGGDHLTYLRPTPPDEFWKCVEETVTGGKADV